MTGQKAMVEKYTDGFRTGDLEKILSCLTEDVVWALRGDKTLVGRDAFAEEADGGGPNPQLTLDRLIEEDETVAVVGHGSVALGDGDPVEFVYSEVFTFADGLICRLDTFHIWLGEVPAA